MVEKLWFLGNHKTIESTTKYYCSLLANTTIIHLKKIERIKNSRNNPIGKNDVDCANFKWEWIGKCSNSQGAWYDTNCKFRTFEQFNFNSSWLQLNCLDRIWFIVGMHCKHNKHSRIWKNKIAQFQHSTHLQFYNLLFSRYCFIEMP